MTLILGADGQLGTALRSLVPAATGLTAEDLDLTDTAAIRPNLAARAPKAIINCAAYNDVDGAETDEATAVAVNATAVGEMAAYAAEHGIPFVTFSSDYVFDGTAAQPYVESDARNPISAYGRSKAAGEDLALMAYPRALVIRTSWLISGMGNDFVSKILRLAREQSVKVVDDQHGRPTIVDDLAAATLQAVDRDATGILHLANRGATTWFDLARAAAALAGMDPDRIIPCSSDEFLTAAERPSYSVLDSERTDHFGIDPLPHWGASLTVVVERWSTTLA